MKTAVLPLLLLALAAPARADERPTDDTLAPRDTAEVLPAGATSVGVFNPLAHGFAHGLELSTHPLVAIPSPNVLARLRVFRDGPWVASVEAGASLPWAVFSQPPPLGLRGYLSPSCLVKEAEPGRAPDSCQEPGLFLVPRLGAAVSYGREHVSTARLDAAFGIPLDGERTDPLDAWPWADLLFAPIFNGHRVHASLRHDRALLSWLRLGGELHGWHVGEGPPPARDPWVFGAWLGADARLSSSLRATLGVFLWNSDQRRVELVKDADGFSRFEPARSTDLAPTLDLIWTWGGPAPQLP